MARTTVPHVKDLYIDDQGRYIFIEKKDFWGYCKSKNISLAEILRMSIAKRKEFFLHWKHGLTDPHVNEEIENSEWACYGSEMETLEDKLDSYFKERIISWRNFEKYCYPIKQTIGLVGSNHPAPINMERQDKNWQD